MGVVIGIVMGLLVREARAPSQAAQWAPEPLARLSISGAIPILFFDDPAPSYAGLPGRDNPVACNRRGCSRSVSVRDRLARRCERIARLI
jgi:hypothetical protein